jgi:hypothetical protein
MREARGPPITLKFADKASLVGNARAGRYPSAVDMLRLGRLGRSWHGVLFLFVGAACSSSNASPNDPVGGQSGASSAAAGMSSTAGSAITAGGGGASAGAGSGVGGASAGVGTGGSVTTVGGGGAGGGASVADTVTRKASSFMFRHFPIETNSDGVWTGPESPAGPPITTAYDTVVLENGYLRVTILPSYGGRVLSIVHKPTGRELLYQNPLGTPYLMKDGIFYYDYLVIMGGIFPSFPEPEHGRYWNQPYDLEVVHESAEAITLRMSRKDDRGIVTGIPARYDVGRTDVLVQLEVTLRAGSAALELNTKLTNTRTTAVPSFEYWTVTTLAPGSVPGQTTIPLETRILAKMDKVRLLDESWPWFKEAETNVSADVYQWLNLASFKNWKEQGTAFANPQYGANWSGLANDTNGTNVLRVSDNVKTPGLKLWTFGRDSLTVDIENGDEWVRPTIEMWHGVTPEFWQRGTLAASEVRTWTDRYFATLGLSDITAASEHGAMYLSRAASGSDTVLSVAASLTQPNQTVKAILRLDANVLAEQDVLAAAGEATKLSATVPSSMISAGAVLEAEFLQGSTSWLKGQISLN